MNINKNTYFITGGAGFIGSNFIRFLFKRYGNGIRVINLDKLTYAGNENNLSDIEKDFHDNYKFIKVDITDDVTLSEIFKKYSPDIIVNFAAESHVDRSIKSPENFIQTNTFGVFKLLEHFKDNFYKDEKWIPNKRFIQISTDEVYGETKNKESFSEVSPLFPSSPYAASKASADLLAYSFVRTFKAPVIITRSSNNFGPYQYPEKLIPLIVNNCLNKKPIPIYGDGGNIRDWLYVEDNVRAIDIIINRGKSGEIYNIGGGNEISNIAIAKIIIDLVKNYTNSDIDYSLIRFVKDRKGHDKRYSLKTDKIRSLLNWKPETELKTALERTVRWYIDNRKWLENSTDKEYNLYYKDTYGE